MRLMMSVNSYLTSEIHVSHVNTFSSRTSYKKEIQFLIVAKCLMSMYGRRVAEMFGQKLFQLNDRD